MGRHSQYLLRCYLFHCPYSATFQIEISPEDDAFVARKPSGILTREQNSCCSAKRNIHLEQGHVEVYHSAYCACFGCKLLSPALGVLLLGPCCWQEQLPAKVCKHTCCQTFLHQCNSKTMRASAAMLAPVINPDKAPSVR